MTKTFKFEFDEEKPNSLTYDVTLAENEKLDILLENGLPIVYLNRPAMLTLAKILIKMAMGSLTEGFHLHLRKDFNPDEADRLTLMLSPDDAPPPPGS